MISVNKALEHIFELAKQLEAEQVSLKDASGRILARSIIANRDQPPFSASAMDGYAICGEDLDKGIKKWTVIGEAGAGHRFGENVTSGEATRIFTGAPMPKGTNQVIIQENVELQKAIQELKEIKEQLIEAQKAEIERLQNLIPDVVEVSEDEQASQWADSELDRIERQQKLQTEMIDLDATVEVAEDGRVKLTIPVNQR